MSLAALLAAWWPSVPSTPPPDLLIAVDEPGAEVIVTRRKTRRSMRVYVEAWSDAQVIVNGEPR